MPNSLRFWACARHANCRNEVRIAKNCPRVATRIAKLASELPPELPGGACESPAELGLLSVCSNGHMTRSDRAHARIAKSCPRVATRIATLAQSSCYPSCQAVHASSQLNWVAVCTLEWSHGTQRSSSSPNCQELPTGSHPNCQAGPRAATRIARRCMRVVS